jgi:predicted transcriptional regulator
MSDRSNVGAFMARKLITLTPEMEINRAVTVLLDNNISGAPVIDATGRLVGLLSMKDCLAAALKDTYYQEWGSTVGNYMSKEVETLNADLDIVNAAEKFVSSNFRRFPVMSDGRLVGQISRADVLKALAELWSRRAGGG